MNKPMSEDTPNLSRRKILQYMAAAPAFAIVGCGGSGNSGSVYNGTTTDSTTTTTTPPEPPSGGMGGMGGGTTERVASTCTSSQSGFGRYVAGGTDLITVDYPDTSIFDSAGTCNISLTQSTTKGPCYFNDVTGEDITQGNEGLPMQLCLRVVDSNCQPLAGRTVEVWHCDTDGIYSGDTSGSSDASRFAGDFCTGGDEEAQNSHAYRGQLVTDAEGRVNFKTCFPGWYRGRTLHIHFSVSNDGVGNNGVISQLCFPDAFVTEVFTQHCSYTGRGDQDTPLTQDGVFRTQSLIDSSTMSYQENSDGTLLAYHNIMVSA